MGRYNLQFKEFLNDAVAYYEPNSNLDEEWETEKIEARLRKFGCDSFV